MANPEGFGRRWRLDSLRCVITGSTKGIGLATAREVVALGGSVLVNGRDADDLAEAVDGLGALAGDPSRVRGCVADVALAAGRADLVSAARQWWGGACDALVNNAGCNTRAPVLEQSPEDYARITALNADAPYHLTRDFFPLLKQGRAPCVVNVASVAGLQSTGSGAAYAMSKAAVVQLTKTLACEWAKHGVRVNAVAPWVTRTPLLEDALAASAAQRESFGRALAATPMKRPAEPEEMASVAAFLMMPASSYVNGQAVAVDGGLLCSGFMGPCTD